MKRVTGWCFAWSVLIACAGSDDPTPGKYGSICNNTRPCESGLMCASASGLDGVCTKTCTIMPNSTECSTQFGPGSICDNTGRCYDQCTAGGGECPPGLDCTLEGVQQGTCRAPR